VGTRVTAADADAMFYMLRDAHGEIAFSAAQGAHHYRIVGLFAHTGQGGSTNNFGLVQLNPSLTTTADIPHHIIIDRCYFLGREDPSNSEVQRAIALHANHAAVIESRIEAISHTGSDSQAIWWTNCEGPILIRNCFLEASGENILVGGADPRL